MVRKSSASSWIDTQGWFLLGGMSESQSDHVELKDFERTSIGVESMIDFCYSGSLSVTLENIEELLHAATHLQIPAAIDLCCQYLLQSCSIANCIDLHKIADIYSLSSVLDYIHSFISKNFLHLISQARNQFEQLTYEQMREHFFSDTLEMHHYEEYDLFAMVCAWIEVNRLERDKHALGLFQSIRFMLMTPEQLTDDVREHPLLKLNEQSRKLVEDALCFYALPNRQALLDHRQNRIRNDPALVAIGEVELFTLNAEEERWESLCRAPLEENYPVSIVVLSWFQAEKHTEITDKRAARHTQAKSTASQLASIFRSLSRVCVAVLFSCPVTDWVCSRRAMCVNRCQRCDVVRSFWRWFRSACPFFLYISMISI